MNKKIVNQVKRVLKHCQEARQQHIRLEERGVGSSLTHDDFNINKGWVEALEFVINAIENGSPVSDKPLIDEGVSAEIQTLKEKKKERKSTQLIGDFIKTKESK